LLILSFFLTPLAGMAQCYCDEAVHSQQNASDPCCDDASSNLAEQGHTDSDSEDGCHCSQGCCSPHLVMPKPFSFYSAGMSQDKILSPLRSLTDFSPALPKKPPR